MRGLQDTAVLRTVDDAMRRQGRREHQICDPMRTAGAEAAFHGLLDDALAEITRRDSSYLGRFGLVLPPLRKLVGRYLRHPLFASFPETAIEAGLSSAIEH